MTVLSWDKPAKIMSVDEWKSILADDAPPGVYTPNMSEADKLKWKAKLVGITKGEPQVEIRKTAANGTQMLIIVGLDGYNYKSYKREPARYEASTKGTNVHISLNGPAQLTFEDFEELGAAVSEARAVLEHQISKV